MASLISFRPLIGVLLGPLGRTLGCVCVSALFSCRVHQRSQSLASHCTQGRRKSRKGQRVSYLLHKSSELPTPTCCCRVDHPILHDVNHSTIRLAAAPLTGCVAVQSMDPSHRLRHRAAVEAGLGPTAAAGRALEEARGRPGAQREGA